jgi:hypothetical protein
MCSRDEPCRRNRNYAFWMHMFLELPEFAHTLCIKGSCWKPFSIHEDFLYDTERLRQVELIHCNIGWDSRFLTGLTSTLVEFELFDYSIFACITMNACINRSSSYYPVIDLPCLRVQSFVWCWCTDCCSFPHTAILN